jgi:hypothetical protein
LQDPNCGGATLKVSKEAASKAHNNHIRVFEQDTRHLLAYSDRSLLAHEGHPRVGVAFVMYHRINVVREREIGPGTRAEVFDGEMEGLAQAAKEALVYAMNHPTIKHLHFYADNTSAIQNIFVAKPTAGYHRSETFRIAITAFLDADLAPRWKSHGRRGIRECVETSERISLPTQEH